jgi:hypothetical protein
MRMLSIFTGGQVVCRMLKVISNDKRVFTEPLPSSNSGGIHTRTQMAT